MAFSVVNNVEIKGISACVPERIERNRDSQLISEDKIEQYIAQVGVEERHCAVHDGTICTSDLCLKAAEKLISDLGWNKEEIKLLVFVSQTRDYKLPSTACILQNRLGLSTETMAFDVPLGCSGYVYGLSIASSLLSSGFCGKALLLVGNTQSFYASPLDKSTSLLFGDAGTATALEYNKEAEPLYFHLYTDGGGYKALIVPDGECRNPFNRNSLEMVTYEEGITRAGVHEKMDGMEVFSFAISQVPKSIKGLIDFSNTSLDDINYLLLHQANKFICEKIRKKIKVVEEKIPYNIDRFGNTSAASIPLLIVTDLRHQLSEENATILGSGFGVGLSIGTFIASTNKLIIPELITLK